LKTDAVIEEDDRGNGVITEVASWTLDTNVLTGLILVRAWWTSQLLVTSLRTIVTCEWMNRECTEAYIAYTQHLTGVVISNILLSQST